MVSAREKEEQLISPSQTLKMELWREERFSSSKKTESGKETSLTQIALTRTQRTMVNGQEGQHLITGLFFAQRNVVKTLYHSQIDAEDTAIQES